VEKAIGEVKKHLDGVTDILANEVARCVEIEKRIDKIVVADATSKSLKGI